MELGDKVLVAAHSKTHKTNLILELAVAVATGTPFLNKFDVPQRGRVGLVMMEDSPRHVGRRLSRLAAGRGRTMQDLDGFVYVWPSPPLVLNTSSVGRLRGWIEELELDVLVIDNFALVADGNSNNADEVTPQLVALTQLARNRPGLTVVLIHHGKKLGPDSGNRLVDIVRGSGAFTAWYGCGIVLSRKDETSPVEVRIELRNLPAPPSFKFEVEDEEPGNPEKGIFPTGWLRLRVIDPVERARVARTESEKAVLTFLRENPGCSKSALVRSVAGKKALRAFEALCNVGRARCEAPDKPGQACKCYAVEEDDDGPDF